MATVIMIINYNCTVITIVNYDPKTFIVQATGLLTSDSVNLVIFHYLDLLNYHSLTVVNISNI